ncbi:hypothetical protein BGZ94_003428, partial [Podila epigama]
MTQVHNIDRTTTTTTIIIISSSSNTSILLLIFTAHMSIACEKAQALKHALPHHEEFFSGDSDSDHLQDGPPSRASSSLPKKPLSLSTDPTLPPLPPSSSSSSSAIASAVVAAGQQAKVLGTPYGYGSMGAAPLSISTLFSGSSNADSSSELSARDLKDSRDSSTTRLKEMIKRNVGLTSPQSATSMSSSSLFSLQTSGQPLSLDDLQPYYGRFSVSRLTGRRRRDIERARGEDKPHGALSARGSLSDDEDSSPLTMQSRQQQQQQQHRHRHFFHRHEDPSAPALSAGGSEPTLASSSQTRDDATGENRVSDGDKVSSFNRRTLSKALQDARAANNDPNTLLAELPPLPLKFMKAFTTLSWSDDSPALSATTAETDSNLKDSPLNRIINIPPLPVLMYSLPTVAPVFNYSAGYSYSYGYGYGYGPSTTTVRRSPSQRSTAPSNASVIMGSTSGGPFPRLPPSARSMTSSSSVAHPPHRSAESAAATLTSKSFLFKAYENARFQGHYILRVFGNQVEYGKVPVNKENCCSQYFRQADVTYRSLERRYRVAKDAMLQRLEQSRNEWQQHLNRHTTMGTDEAVVPRYTTLVQHATTRSEPTPRTSSSLQAGNVLPATVDTSKPQRVLLSGPGEDLVQSQMPLNTDKVNEPYEDRKQDQDSERSMAPELVLTPPPEDSPEAWPSNEFDKIERAYEDSCQEKLMKAHDDAFWYRFEQDRCQEDAEAVYGLDVFLDQITQDVEFERFEAVALTEISNDNRGSPLFTIANGDGTNMIWLESPSVKLKNQFLNWFAISLMDERDPVVSFTSKEGTEGTTHLDLLNERITESSAKTEVDQSKEDETLVDIMTVNVTIMEKRIAWMRQKMNEEMKRIEDTLDQLDNLDNDTKRLMTTIQTVVEDQEVQLALQPAPTTGLTLADLVVRKISEVDQRIVACTKIMSQARQNLNRLKYEMVLEQRSIRLFRQYKIMIAVISLVVLAL